ncbi:hypothetical protein HYPSUDRAFT_39898 [Hypholoma sublateritium FD-334 SS-4]|uniref:Uncharacterized protein n=1 Tax=Hypholoma sublateritium (strain FD-334 SS-4) TaxID=945553 RepID=A0A0D2PV59_HYPSF|nr:hypothetical protein HYPSUDRAFT_39898 [Hypholoma sublateritium FD-334 SS-4]
MIIRFCNLYCPIQMMLSLFRRAVPSSDTTGTPYCRPAAEDMLLKAAARPPPSSPSFRPNPSRTGTRHHSRLLTQRPRLPRRVARHLSRLIPSTPTSAHERTAG